MSSKDLFVTLILCEKLSENWIQIQLINCIVVFNAMINGCVTSKSSSPSSPISMMSPSSLHSSPQASSSFSQDRSPVSSPSRTTFQSVPLLKPSAIKDPSVHFPPSTLPSMCFPLHALYTQNPYSGIVGSNLSTFFSPHAIARQMSFLGNSFSQNLSGNYISISLFPNELCWVITVLKLESLWG